MTYTGSAQASAPVNLYRVTPSGVVTTIAGGTVGYYNTAISLGSYGNFNLIAGVAVSQDGNRIYVSDSNNDAIRLVQYNGTGDRDNITSYTVSIVAGTYGGTLPGPLTPVAGFTDGVGAKAAFKYPGCLALYTDAGGNEVLFVADTGNHAIRRIDSPAAVDGSGNSAAVVRTIAGATPAVGATAGSTDGPGSAARFRSPVGLACVPLSNGGLALYVTQEASGSNNSTIRQVVFSGGDSTVPENYTVSTISGGSATDGFADGAGSVALFNNPLGVAAIGGSGPTIYVADTNNNRIRQITIPAPTNQTGTNGSTSTEPVRIVNADGEVPNQTGWYKNLNLAQTAQLQFYVPSGVTGFSFTAYLDGDTNLINLPAAGATYLTTLAGDGVAGWADGPGKLAEFNAPTSVAAVPANLQYAYGTPIRAFMTDSANARIRYIDTSGNVGTFAGSSTGFADGVGNAAQFNSPHGIAVGPDGCLWVADYGNHRIRRITPSGSVTTIAGTGTASSTDGSGNVATVNAPEGVGVDAGGTVYFADSNAQVVRKVYLVSGDPSVAASYNVLTVAGSTNTAGDAAGTGTTALFHTPTGVAVDTNGTVYVCDTSNAKVKVLTRTTLTTMTSATFASSASGVTLSWVLGVALDSAHNVYVCDNGAARIIRYNPAGSPTTLCGGSNGSSDGSNGLLNAPAEVAVESAGSVLVADQGNNKLRAVQRMITTAQPTPPTP